MVERTFQRLLKSARNEEVLIPALRSALYNPSFEAFTVPTQEYHERTYDGMLHPSTHPLWPERLLYYYLTQGKDFENNPMDDLGTMAVTQGNFWHAFIQRVMLDAKIIRNVNPGAVEAHDKAELYVEDKRLLTRGWMDGVLNSDMLSVEEDEGIELKTISSMKTRSLPKGSPSDPERIRWLKEKCPQYYAQAQEYLRMSRLPRQRFLFINLEYPFTFHEILISFDPPYSRRLVQKYEYVIQCVADHILPDPCCGLKSKESKECAARYMCPVGKVSIGG